MNFIIKNVTKYPKQRVKKSLKIQEGAPGSNSNSSKLQFHNSFYTVTFVHFFIEKFALVQQLKNQRKREVLCDYNHWKIFLTYLKNTSGKFII